MNTLYETEKLVSEYLLFHYGSRSEILNAELSWPENIEQALFFPVRTPALFSTTRSSRGLDLGCSVGRSTFEMTRSCDEVIGIDFSNAFIETAQRLQHQSHLAYTRHDEGGQYSNLTAHLPTNTSPARATFLHGDAMNLPENLGTFDRIHASNLICRLSEPLRLLNRLPSLLNPQGELILATPCTWLEQFTPPHHWPKGDTFSWLEQCLSKDFTLASKSNEPFLIRETARKFQWSHALVTKWIKHA
jgi:putative 4-mercaptohistidine N1-methyltranferase